MVDWYQTYFIDTGRSATLCALVGFLVTFGFTRWITRRIHLRKTRGDDHGPSAIKDVHIGGVHIHHQVWGILLVLVVGLLEFRLTPGSPWQEVLATSFGVGAALALDEFALWLHLEDVYWSAEGRKSIDAVMVAVVIGLAVLVGTSPIGVDQNTVATSGLIVASIAVVVHIGYTIVCLLKGKVPTGLIGLTVPVISLVGAIRLALPTSFWARRFYSDRKLARAHERFKLHDARRERLRTLFSGSADIESGA